MKIIQAEIKIDQYSWTEDKEQILELQNDIDMSSQKTNKYSFKSLEVFAPQSLPTNLQLKYSVLY